MRHNVNEIPFIAVHLNHILSHAKWERLKIVDIISIYKYTGTWKRLACLPFLLLYSLSHTGLFMIHAKKRSGNKFSTYTIQDYVYVRMFTYLYIFHALFIDTWYI